MKQTDTQPLQPPISVDELNISDEMRETLERMQKLYEFSSTKSDELQNLYREGKTEELSEAIEELAYNLMEQDDPEYLELLDARKRDPKLIIKDRVLEINNSYKQFIISEAGLPDEARFSDIENSFNHIQEILGETPTDPEQALRALGIITQKDENTISYNFPNDLVPDSVNEKWDVYLTTVCSHVKAIDEMKETGDRAKVVDADAIRKYAHDSVTKDVHAILGLEGINGWDYQSTRRLLASMREEVFPTLGSTSVNSSEQEHSIDLLNHYGNKQLRVTSKLSHK